MIKALLAKVGKKLRQLTGSRPQKNSGHAVAVPLPEQKASPVAQPENDLKKRAPRRRRKPEGGEKKKKPEWNLADFPVDPVEGRSRFHEFPLPLALLHGIADLEFKYCTPIQEKALPEALVGKDLIGRAGTGTGKSAVFLIALFTRLLNENASEAQKPLRRPGFPRALIIAPTRELVMQITKDGKALGKYLPLNIVAVYGGTDYQKQEQLLSERPVDVIVATPGRLLDYVAKKVVNLDQVGMMVIDEADRMLDMGFIPDVRRIISRIKPREQRQTLLFSATVNEDVRHLASQWCIKPVYIESDPEQVAVETVKQVIYTVTAEEKYTVLCNLLRNQPHERVMVFVNMKSEAARLHERLKRHGIHAALLTGDVPQQKRMSRLERFRVEKNGVMIATDVAGRGIHIDGISHVVNYTLPEEPEDYVHRIGRTGRAGENGIAVSFACEEGAFHLPDIEEYIGKQLPCVVPAEELLKPISAVSSEEKPKQK
ncbi:DEAD/DEAH box helicase [Candidatus Electronema sp. PJ]|uniref:DEAD/DEAH box helicase n=1 Tax=Candidatus Electronema sp. PJ TaxID=3401572 RepID=UPI003AA88218